MAVDTWIEYYGANPEQMKTLVAWLDWIAAEGGPSKPVRVADDFEAIAKKLKEIEAEKEKAREQSRAS